MPTLARTPAEAAELQFSIQVLVSRGCSIIVADAGSDAGLVEYLQHTPAIEYHHVSRGTGSALVRQIRVVLGAAAARGGSHLLYTEPDKGWFFEHRLDEFVRFATGHLDAGVVIPGRDAASFATFPGPQQLTEGLTNELIGKSLGLEADYLYGPLWLETDLVSCLGRIPDDLGWGWRIYLMAQAHERGRALMPYVADLPCPVYQRNELDAKNRVYRLEQMAQNVRGLALALRAATAV